MLLFGSGFQLPCISSYFGVPYFKRMDKTKKLLAFRMESRKALQLYLLKGYLSGSKQLRVAKFPF